jgi:hypothetical protein
LASIHLIVELPAHAIRNENIAASWLNPIDLNQGRDATEWRDLNTLLVEGSSGWPCDFFSAWSLFA